MASTQASETAVVPLPESAVSAGGERVPAVLAVVQDAFRTALRTGFPTEEDLEPAIALCGTPQLGDYQCNNAMGLFGKLKKAGDPTYKQPRAVAEAILKALPETEAIESCNIAGPGFINIKLNKTWIAGRVLGMLYGGIQTWAPILPYKRCLVDFSAPNIAKEMHVGHLRSTIIGETISRMLEFCGAEVLRRNHVGDWGTQFGMLIQYLEEFDPEFLDREAQIAVKGYEDGKNAVSALQELYKKSKVKFDEDADFKLRAQQAVVKLQGGDEKSREIWLKICALSRKEFEAIYDRLRVRIEERGESFYNPYIPDAIEALIEKGLAVESEGALVVWNEAIAQAPLIIKKRDGGFNYASTDLACIRFRAEQEKAEWLIYITDVGQRSHFDMVFDTARRAGWVKDLRVDHVGFGLVLGDDGKRFRTRSTEVVRLADLLDEAKRRCADQIRERVKEKEGGEGFSDEEVDNASSVMGYGAVKYADLYQNRLSNYTFSFDRMLDLRGNTAVYLLYAYVRIRGINRKAGVTVEELLKKEGVAIRLEHPTEIALGLQLLRFTEAVAEAIDTLLPSRLADYLYDVSGKFSEFYTECKVIGTEQEDSRLLLCAATGDVMRQCLNLLGIDTVERL